MTSACLVWLKDVVARYPELSGPVLDVGSLDVNGSARDLFGDARRFPRYTGLDLQAGQGVQLCGKGDALPFRDESFGVVVCTEVLEHDDHFWMTLLECRRVLRRHGQVVVTTRGIDFPRHDYPSDYWRFTADGLRVALQRAGFEAVDTVEDVDDRGVFAVARRSPVCPPTPRTLERLPVLLTEDELAILRRRFSGFAAVGLTGVGDAFERVASDRVLLLRLVEDAEALLGGGYSSDAIQQWVQRVHRATGGED